jgi:hypothetical protein
MSTRATRAKRRRMLRRYPHAQLFGEPSIVREPEGTSRLGSIPMKPTEDEFGLRLAAKAADRGKAFAEHWPAVRAQLEQRGYSSWGSGKRT